MDLTTAPWWGVPVIAGGFLVVGAFLGFLFTRANDKRREKRLHHEAVAKETMDIAAEYIVFNQKFEMLAQRGLTVSIGEFLPILVDQSGPLIEQHNVFFTRLRLVMPDHLEKDLQAYSAATVFLVTPPFEPDIIRKKLDHQNRTGAAFIAALREVRGLAPLKHHVRAGGQLKKEELADRMTAELIRQLEANGIDIENHRP
jgi:hypothetical protein